MILEGGICILPHPALKSMQRGWVKDQKQTLWSENALGKPEEIS